MRHTLLPVAAALLLLGCLAPAARHSAEGRDPSSELFHQQQLTIMPINPPVKLRPGANQALLRRQLLPLDPAQLSGRRMARKLRADTLPFLTETTVGRAFLQAAPPRALARGDPASSCPALAVGTGDGSPTRVDAAMEALERCLAQLEGGSDGCGCMLLALDDVALAPQGAFAYAKGIPARLYGPALGLDLMLVAEEASDGGALLRDLRGPVGVIERHGGRSVSLLLSGYDHPFRGFSIPVGFRHGRIAERIYVADSEGHRVSLLIGFDPAELAERAAAWLAWPRRDPRPLR